MYDEYGETDAAAVRSIQQIFSYDIYLNTLDIVTF